MKKNVNNITKCVLFFLAFFIPFRELIALYTNDFAKFIPDVLIWVLLFFVIIKNKFKMNLKKYDYFFIGFIFIGFISCLYNSVSLLAYALQVRSIGTMYVLFYILRNVDVEQKDYQLIAKILKYISIFIVLFAIIEFFFDKTILFPKYWADNILYKSNFVRTYSLMNNPNTFAIFIFMVMFFNYILFNDEIKNKNIFYYTLCFIGIILSASRSTILVLILFAIYLLICSINKKSYYNVLMMILLFLLSFGISYAFSVIKVSIITQNSSSVTSPNNSNNDVNIDKEEKEETPNLPLGNITIIDRFQESTSNVTIANSNTNGRLFNIKKGIEIFKDYPIIGTGFGTYGSAASKMVTPKLYEKYNLQEKFYTDNEYIKVIVETGIIGVMAFVSFILLLLYEFYQKHNIEQIFIFIAFLFIGMFYNVFEMAVMCFVLYLSFQAFENNKKKVNERKIMLLALHLGYGGCEQVIINTANMLSNNYDVEIISLYKSKEKIPFKINNNVKISYLMNVISNKKELKLAVKKFNVYKIIIEGIKSIYILINKNNCIRKAIKNSDAKVIISSRYKFSKIANYNINNNVILIHHEHTYSISDKYINNINKLKNLNNIIAVSRPLYDAYKNKIKTKLIYIPNALNYFPTNDEISRLETKNIISIGRLEEEKGFKDLISIINKLNDKSISLYLFGDGSQKDELKKIIEKLKLKNQIKLFGFKNNDFIKKYMQESSLYIMTSYEESFGLVLIEAMSYGIPCISYDSATGAKNLINKKNGFFIKNRNEKEMVNTINKYFDLNQSEKIKFGIEARKTSENYKYDIIKKEWLKFISSLEENK